MTRLSSLQENGAAVTGTNEIPLCFAERVKLKSTLLVTVSWQSSGAPNSISILGVSVIPDPFNTPLVRVPVAYTPVAGIGGSPPIYAGPTGNTINMAVIAVKCSDIRSIQNTTFPSNIVVKMSGTCGRIDLRVQELANFPSFKFRDVSVQAVSNQTGTSMTLSGSQRPSSLNVVGWAVAAGPKRTVNTPWAGGDSRSLGNTAVAQLLASTAPWAVGSLASTTAKLLGGVGSANDPVRGHVKLPDGGGAPFAGMAFPIPSGADALRWSSQVRTGVDASVMAWADGGTYMENIRDLSESNFQYETLLNSLVWENTPVWVINPVYIADSTAAELADGASAPLLQGFNWFQVQATDVVVISVESGADALKAAISDRIGVTPFFVNVWDFRAAADQDSWTAAVLNEVATFLGPAGETLRSIFNDLTSSAEQSGPGL